MRKIWLWCAKGRTYTDTSKTRFTSSRITECPFKATLTRIPVGQGLEVKDPTYNYAAAINLIALPQYYQRTYNINKTIANISSSSIRASKILINLLKKDIIKVYKKRALIYI